MELQLIELLKIKPSELDAFLELGWFRIQQSIFTTRILNFNGMTYPTIWLRVPLIDFLPGKKFRALSRKNSRFKTEIKKAIYTLAHETLYATYKADVSFESAPTLQWLLYGNNTRDVYNTYMINVYDGKRLIGAGFFDLGDTSAAGICSIYDPEYKRYSLGKYMIYEKIIYCKKERYDYFYPGYFVPGYPRFDYKLEIGKPAIEYFDTREKKWLALFPKYKHASNGQAT